MINTIDELKAAFDNISGEKLIDNDYINSQNICQYCSGDENSLMYGEMNNIDVMFDYRTYVDRIQKAQNMKFGKCSFKNLFSDRVWEAFSEYRENALGIDAIVCNMPGSIEVALVEHLIWYPETNSVRPVIVIPSKFNFWDTTRAKAWMYPQLAYYTYVVVESIAKEHKMKTEYPLMIVRDSRNEFAVYDMTVYVSFHGTSDVLQAMTYIRRVIKENISIKNNIKEGCVCMFK